MKKFIVCLLTFVVLCSMVLSVSASSVGGVGLSNLRYNVPGTFIFQTQRISDTVNNSVSVDSGSYLSSAQYVVPVLGVLPTISSDLSTGSGLVYQPDVGYRWTSFRYVSNYPVTYSDYVNVDNWRLFFDLTEFDSFVQPLISFTVRYVNGEGVGATTVGVSRQPLLDWVNRYGDNQIYFDVNSLYLFAQSDYGGGEDDTVTVTYINLNIEMPVSLNNTYIELASRVEPFPFADIEYPIEFNNVNWASNLAHNVGAFLDVSIAPGLSLGGILLVVVGICMLFAFLKFFAGG